MAAKRLSGIAALCSLAISLTAACGSNGEPSASISSEDPVSQVSGVSKIRKIIENGPTPLIRTDFSDDEAWRKIVAITTAPDATDLGASEDEPLEPNVETVEDEALDGWSTTDLTAAFEMAQRSGYALVADAQSMREAKGTGIVTVDYVDLNDSDLKPGEKDEYGFTIEDYELEYGRSFRCQLEQVASIEANLSIANMDFFEFADTADENGGVFTGFGE